VFGADVLTFREFMMDEPLPLATLHQGVLEFLRGRDDVVLFGAQAVNAYVNEPRMTQDLDLMATDPEAVSEALRNHLHDRFHIAVRSRSVSGGRGLRVYQSRKEGNRHLVDLRRVETLPESVRVAEVLVMAPAGLIASKVISYHQRRAQPKAGTDWRDLAMLLLTFPDLKSELGQVADQLRAAGATPDILAAWQDIVAQDIRPAAEDDEF
jgi:hypothetical protein